MMISHRTTTMAKVVSIVFLASILSSAFALPERVKRNIGKKEYKDDDGKDKAKADAESNSSSSSSESSSSSSSERGGCDGKPDKNCNDSGEEVIYPKGKIDKKGQSLVSA